MYLLLKSQQSHDSETWTTFSMFFDMSLQKNVKVTFLGFEKKRKKTYSRTMTNVASAAATTANAFFSL